MNRPVALSHQNKDAIVVLDDVWVRYNEKWVLKSIHLSCFPGEILGIVGPNGSGKTTLLSVILGLIHPEKGTVRLFGRAPDKESRREVGYLPQISRADRSFPVAVLDVVLMGLYSRLGLFRRPDADSIRKAMDLLHQVNMADHAHHPFGALSGGQQQRVQIARALASQPRLLVLDEPATGIDTVAQEDFYELLARLRDEQGISVLMVSHDIGMITAHADQVACLNREIHYHGKPESCLSPEIQQKVFGDHVKVILHDAACATCLRRHRNDS